MAEQKRPWQEAKERGQHMYHFMCSTRYWEYCERELFTKGLVTPTQFRCKCSTTGDDTGEHVHYHAIVVSKLTQDALRKRYTRYRKQAGFGEDKKAEGYTKVKRLVCDLHMANTIHYIQCRKGQKGHVHYDFNTAQHAGACKPFKTSLLVRYGIDKASHATCECQKTFDAFCKKMSNARLARKLSKKPVDESKVLAEMERAMEREARYAEPIRLCGHYIVPMSAPKTNTLTRPNSEYM